MYHIDWFSPNIKNWKKWLDKFKGKPNLLFLEIGCFEGKASEWLFENILTDPTSSICLIDTFEGGMEVGEKGTYYAEKVLENLKENIKKYLDRADIRQGVSQVLLRSEEFGREMFDFIYIDGSHRSPEVLEDSILAWRLLKKGGVLVWDDYGWHLEDDRRECPKMGIDAFLDVFKNKYKVIDKGYQVAIEKL